MSSYEWANTVLLRLLRVQGQLVSKRWDWHSNRQLTLEFTLLFPMIIFIVGKSSKIISYETKKEIKLIILQLVKTRIEEHCIKIL